MAGEADARAGTGHVTLGAFLVMCTLAGGNVVAVRYQTRGGVIDPFWAAATRFLFATAIFAAIAAVVRAPMPRGRALAGAVLYGALGFGGFFGFAYYGLSEVPAAFGGVILASVPLLTFLLAMAHGLERFRWVGLAGSLLAVGGTAVIVSDGLDAGVPLWPLLSIIGAAASGAEAALVVKAFPPVHPVAMNAVGMAIGAAILFVLTFAFGESQTIAQSTETWAAQAYLVIAGSIAVFTLYLYVLKRWTASAVSYEFVLIPLVGVVLSAWLLDEDITVRFAIGAVLVLIGVYYGALRALSRRTPSPD